VVAMVGAGTDPDGAKDVEESEEMDSDAFSKLPKDPWLVDKTLQIDLSSVSRGAKRAEEVFEDMCKDARRMLARADLALDDIRPKS
jgi:hypothetical protein